MKKGSALLLTLVTVLFVFLLAAAALGVTSGSRDLTGRYRAYSGAYDMALAGNAYAFSVYTYATQMTAEEYGQALSAAGFALMGSQYTLNWSANINTGLAESFEAATSVSFSGNNITVQTGVTKYVPGQTGSPVKVAAEFQIPNNFDAYEPPVLKSKRIYET